MRWVLLEVRALWDLRVNLEKLDRKANLEKQALKDLVDPKDQPDQ